MGKIASNRWAAENLKDFHEGVLLHCPVRGPLSAKSLATDGLSPSEEARRVDLIKYLLHPRVSKREYSRRDCSLEELGGGWKKQP